MIFMPVQVHLSHVIPRDTIIIKNVSVHLTSDPPYTQTLTVCTQTLTHITYYRQAYTPKGDIHLNIDILLLL